MEMIEGKRIHDFLGPKMLSPKQESKTFLIFLKGPMTMGHQANMIHLNPTPSLIFNRILSSP